MIGKPVLPDELKEVLGREESRKERRKQFELELKTIRPDECLLYESKVGVGSLAGLALASFVAEIDGLKMITEGDKTYIYREK